MLHLVVKQQPYVHERDSTESLSFLPSSQIEVMHETVAKARRLLKETSYSSLHKLTLKFENNQLIISGEVISYHLKQVAITLVMKAGCKVVATDLLVKAKK